VKLPNITHFIDGLTVYSFVCVGEVFDFYFTNYFQLIGFLLVDFGFVFW